MKLLPAFLLFLLPAAAAPVDLDALAAAALAAPGELGAEALLRISGIDTLPKIRRMELIEQAFAKAAAAQQPYKRKGAQVRAQAAINLLNKVHSQDLSALDLRLRAVEALQPLDAARARSLFAKIPEVRLPRLKCADFLVYDIARFYDVLEKIATAESDPAERVRLLQPYVRATQSPAQIAGIARLLATSGVDDSGFQALLADFVSALATIKGDDRSFVDARGIGRQIGALKKEAEKRKISPLPLLESYRVYLVFNLSGPRCADSDAMQGGRSQAFVLQTPEGSDPQAAEFAGYFNEKLRIAPLQPIQPLEVTPARVEGVAGGSRSCEDPECQGFVARYQTLMSIPKNTPAWGQKVEETAAGLAQWRASSHAGAAQFFLEKSAAYSELLNIAPAGPARTIVVKGLVGHIERSPIQQSARAEWLLTVNSLTGRLTLDPLGFGMYAESLRKSPDKLVVLFTELELAAPRSQGRILPLL